MTEPAYKPKSVWLESLSLNHYVIQFGGKWGEGEEKYHFIITKHLSVFEILSYRVSQLFIKRSD